jgi:sec-independent protein translocase protein TatA
MVLAEIIGWDIVIVLAIIALLFGGAKLPKLARSLGSAKGEFEKGLKEGAPESKATDAKATEAKATEATDKTDS